jgi:Xaa-Pro aminopeptidase
LYASQVPYSWEVRKKYVELPFELEEYHKRVETIRRSMEEKGVDALVIFGTFSDHSDLVYVSNFLPTTRAAVVVRKEKDPVVITDAILHGEPINSFSWMTWIHDFEPVPRNPTAFAQALRNILDGEGAKKVAISGRDNLPMSILQELSKLGSQIEWVDFQFDMIKIKTIRSNSEVKLMRELGRMTALAMQKAVELTRDGVMECEVVAFANKVMYEEGAHDLFFPTIVNSGPRGGLKHSYPTKRKIRNGDLVYIDMGAMKYGYGCDMSRTVAIGGASEEQRDVLGVILNAYNTLRSMMRPDLLDSKLAEKGKQLEDEAQFLRKRYPERVYLGLSGHHAVGTGHADLPTTGFPDVALQPNMTFAFEPMAHILDFGTAVIEDMILVTSEGNESMTEYELVHW